MAVDNSVTVTNGDTVVTGSLTSFVGASGDILIVNGLSAEISRVDSTSKLTLKTPWPGPTQADQVNWRILNVGPYWHSTVSVNKRLVELVAKIEMGYPLEPDASGTLSQRTQYEGSAEGFVFLRTDSNPWQLYMKRSATTGDWAGPSDLAGGTGGGGTPAPTITLQPLTLSNAAIAENSPAGTTVGALQGVTTGSTLSLSNNAGGRFALNGALLIAGSTALDYESATSHQVTVRETYGGAANSPRDTTFTITVTDVAENVADTTPDPFTFQDVTNANFNTAYTSNTITVSGVNANTPISITGAGAQYSINGGAYTSAAGTVKNGDAVAVRVTSANAASTAVNATLTIGGISDTYTVTTAAAASDTTPDAFIFTDVTGATLNTLYTSNPITVTGINGPAPISISGGTYSINNGAFTAAAGTVNANDQVRVQVTSANANGTAVNATLTIGGVADTYTVTTVAAPTLAALTLSNASLPEGSVAGTVVGTIQGSTSGSTLSLTSDGGGRFAIQGTNLVAGTVTTDYEAQSSYQITLRETLANAANSPRDTTLTVTVTDVIEPTLVALTLSSATVAENTVAGVTVGDFVGKTAGSTLSLSDDAGGRFALSGSTLVTGLVATDYESATSHQITVVETLAGSPNSPKSTTLTITVTDVTENTLVSPYLIVSTSGNDSTGSGTIAAPYATVDKAVSVATPGTNIYLRGATYNLSAGIQISNKSGTSTSRYTLQSYPGEKAILNFASQASGWPGTGSAGGAAINLSNSSYWTIQDLEISNAASFGIHQMGSSGNNLLRRLNIHHTGSGNRGESGMGTGVACYATGPNIVFENIDSWANTCGATQGDADGFQTCPGGTGATGWALRWCRAWLNSDDGFDAFQVNTGFTQPSITYEGCLAWKNGRLPNDSGWSSGDGNGFKMGGRRSGSSGICGAHKYYNCMSWANKLNGFDENSGNGGTSALTLINCSAYNNAQGTTWGGNFYLFQTVGHVVRNNLALGTGMTNNNAVGTVTNNSWQLGTTPGSGDFVTMSDTTATQARNTDGSLKQIDFLRPSQGSVLIDKGLDVGRPYVGAAPDIGAIEYGSTGGGGGGGTGGSTPWTPANLTVKPLIWLEGDDAATVLLNGVRARQWNDKSTRGNNAAQTTQTLQPDYEAAGINGHGALLGHGGDTTATDQTRIMTIPALASAMIQQVRYEGETLFAVRINGTDYYNSATGAPTLTQPFLIEAVCNGSNYTLYNAGLACGSGVPPANTGGSAGFFLGHALGAGEFGFGRLYDITTTPTIMGRADGLRGWNGYLGIFILLGYEPTTDERQKIEGYALHKYGLAALMPADHPYKASPPTL